MALVILNKTRRKTKKNKQKQNKDIFLSLPRSGLVLNPDLYQLPLNLF